MLWKTKIILLVLTLTGCATQKPMIEYVPTYIEKPVVCNIPEPVTEEFFFVEMEKVQDEEGIWWITPDTENSKKLALNNAKILKYLADLKDYASRLEQCIADTKKES